MKRTDLPITLQHLLQTVPYVTVAAYGGSILTVTPLVGMFDDQLTLYWASSAHNLHSQTIDQSPHIVTVVYDSSSKLGEGVGLFMRMYARKLTDPQEILQARKTYTDRYGEEGCASPFSGTCPRRIYGAQPYEIWCNTGAEHKGHFVDGRQYILTMPVV